MTLDKNGKKIMCGDIVKIEGAYFKNDCGYWLVEQDGTNESYSGDGLTLKKIGKRGKISTAKYNLAFWPLCSFTSDRIKNAEANVHNEKNATIEIVNDIDNTAVIEWIKEEIKNRTEQIEYWENHFGERYESPERKGKAYFEKALARLTAEKEPELTEADENSEITEGMRFTDADGKIFEITELNDMSVTFNGGENALFDFGTSRTIKSVLDALGNGAKLTSSGNNETYTDKPAATEESTTETTDTATEPTESAPAEEVPQTDETTAEEPETETETTTSAAPDMFAELAKAYATGRTVKSTRKATDTAKADKATDTAPEEEKAKTETESAPTQPEFTTGKTLGKLHAEIERNGTKYIVDAADMSAHGDTIDGRYDVMIMTKDGNEVDSTRTDEPEEARKAFWLYCERYTAAEIEKSETGYTPAAHPVITPDDVQKIDNGEQVRHTIDHNIIVAYFATPYNDQTKLLYNINSGYQEDNVHPGTSASYTGFITAGVLYTDESAMRSALDADIETYIRRMIPDEISAKKRIDFDNLEEYKKKEVEIAIQYSRTKEARRLFYDNKEDDLILYRSGRNTYSTATLIRYAENPGEVVKEYAEEYIENNMYKIYAEYIRHNNTSAILEAIKATPEDEAHLLKKISESIGEDQKTVRIELSTGKIVKCDASAVRNIKIMETISDWHIASADRNKLEKCESGYGRKDITADDIKQITYGQRILYQAA